jgi:hypothetical protein
MKKLVLAIGILGVVALGSLGAFPASGTHPGDATAGSSSALTHSSGDRLRTLNIELSPDDVILDDWLCDGMTDCIELSRR